jgi:hypothetical protein
VIIIIIIMKRRRRRRRRRRRPHLRALELEGCHDVLAGWVVMMTTTTMMMMMMNVVMCRLDMSDGVKGETETEPPTALTRLHMMRMRMMRMVMMTMMMMMMRMMMRMMMMIGVLCRLDMSDGVKGESETEPPTALTRLRISNCALCPRGLQVRVMILSSRGNDGFIRR